MKASVTAVAIRSAIREPRELASECLERAKAPGDSEVDDHDRDRDQSVRRGQWLVDRDVAVDDVPDELAARWRVTARCSRRG